VSGVQKTPRLNGSLLGGALFGAIAGGTLNVWSRRGGALDVVGGGSASGGSIAADAAAAGGGTSSARGKGIASGAASTALATGPAVALVA
jgi:hypothetical protein